MIFERGVHCHSWLDSSFSHEKSVVCVFVGRGLYAFSYSVGFMIVSTTQQDNILLRYFLSGTCLTVYIIFVSLSTACSLSIRRRKMYLLANQLFIKASKQRKIRQLFILRKLIKSLGDMNRPTICLTDKSGEEFEPMEFVEFVFNTFSNFTLVAKVFRVHLK